MGASKKTPPPTTPPIPRTLATRQEEQKTARFLSHDVKSTRRERSSTTGRGLWGKSGRIKPKAQLSTRPATSHRPDSSESAERTTLSPHAATPPPHATAPHVLRQHRPRSGRFNCRLCFDVWLPISSSAFWLFWMTYEHYFHYFIYIFTIISSRCERKPNTLRHCGQFSINHVRLQSINWIFGPFSPSLCKILQHLSQSCSIKC